MHAAQLSHGMERRLKLGVVYTSIRMGVVSTSTDREKLNRENCNWLYFRQYCENLDLRKFAAIRYHLFVVMCWHLMDGLLHNSKNDL